MQGDSARALKRTAGPPDHHWRLLRDLLSFDDEHLAVSTFSMPTEYTSVGSRELPIPTVETTASAPVSVVWSVADRARRLPDGEPVVAHLDLLGGFGPGR
jgi:hypothetical protein